jgi:hypothetical protein
MPTSTIMANTVLLLVTQGNLCVTYLFDTYFFSNYYGPDTVIEDNNYNLCPEKDSSYVSLKQKAFGTGPKLTV